MRDRESKGNSEIESSSEYSETKEWTREHHPEGKNLRGR
jgi:hypothetical protein